MSTAVPDWLRGAWTRNWIRRAVDGGPLGEQDATVEVLYIQTPWAFVDVRVPHEGTDGLMAFAGVTTVQENVVEWHACLNFPDAVPAAELWAAADAGTPAPTEDVGVFSPLGEAKKEDAVLWREVDLNKSLEEEWKKIVAPAESVTLAVRRGTDIFVAEAGHFGFASSNLFVAGHVTPAGWICHLSTDIAIAPRGSTLVLPGAPEDWKPLFGCDALENWPSLQSVPNVQFAENSR
eukprot:m.235450 g.235450  ORF g.235450 m.235450 type:complete len:235 (-) comp15761_c0_seq3:1868-2572(-)